jgi:cyanophycinase
MTRSLFDKGSRPPLAWRFNIGNIFMKSIHRRWHLLVLAMLIVVAPAQAQTPRIDPAGIPGALLLCGGDDVSPLILERFVDLAGGDKAKIVGLAVGREKILAPFLERMTAAAKKQNAGETNIRRLPDAKGALRDATGVWLMVRSEKNWQDEMKKHPIADDLRALLIRGGVIATAGPGTNLVQASGGLDLLPGLVETDNPGQKETKLPGRLKAFPGLVGFRIDADAAMLVKGRTISAVGDSKVTIHVAGNPSLREIIVQGKTQADLTALRRSAHDRANSFPPKKVEPPIVENGTLVIVVGGGSPKDLYKKFVEYAGGAGKANIVVFPTANQDPLPKKYPNFITAWEKAGANKVTVLPARTQAEVESKEFLDTLKEATGLWFDGGRQWRFVDCYENTKALPLMFDVLKRGGVIGGTSAGATIQGDYLCRGGVFTNFDIRYEGYERGLGFLKGVAIDQHFTQRKRQAEMTSLMKVYPQYLGIGLDEATAIVVKGHTAEVIGKGKVHFYDANRKVEKGEPDYEALLEGGRYDLKTRKILAGEK